MEDETHANGKGDVSVAITLTIYTTTDCATYDTTSRIAAAVRVQFCRLRVNLVHLDRTPERIPPEVIATPTYLLNDRVVSLGNPDDEDLYARIRLALADDAKERA